MSLPEHLIIASEVQQALDQGGPVVALESTVISHGLPRPLNLEVARRCAAAVHEEGAVPATVGVIAGKVIVGLNDDDIITLALGDDVRKVSRRDFGIVIAKRQHGGTTVAGTMIAAHLAGIRVFATGGIGGVHRGDADDVSADLPELAGTPVAVVCAGAKSILDLPRTLEYLETAGVPVLGYQTDTFPAFYAASSGLPVDERVDTSEQAAAVIRARWEFGLEGGVLVVVPPPAEVALPNDEMEAAIAEALRAADRAGVRGKALTPFLLAHLGEATQGRSLQANIALLEQNARVAARIAVALAALDSSG